jgi:hypothetical protein
MELLKTRTQRRMWITLNFLFLVAGLIAFYLGIHSDWPVVWIVTGTIALILFIVTCIQAFFRTLLWKMTHARVSLLDERQVEVVLNAIRYSYSIFVIVCLLIVYGFAVFALKAIDVVIAGSLLYLAHTLPAAIIGWTENDAE